MPKYAYFNSTQTAPQQVIGWYDTDLFTYTNLPTSENLVEVSELQWNARLSNPSAWAIDGGDLVSYSPPILPITPQAAFFNFLSSGALVQTNTSLVPIGTYAIDLQSQQTITAEAAYINAFSEFTNGSTSEFPWLLYDEKTLVEFPSTSSFMAFTKGVAQLVTSGKLVMQSGSNVMPSGILNIP